MGTLEEGLTLNPNLAYGRALLGRVLRQRANQRGGRQKQTAEIGGNADSAEERNRLGWVLWNGGHFRDALEELYKATLLNPVEENWQCDLAYARITQRDTAGALAAARQAVRLNSESACGHHALALAMEGSGRHEQAALEFQEAESLSSALGAGGLLRQGAPAGNSTTDRR
jgi:tetratricopeptide (TPR) repeat protein